jgi:Ca-activated chloride channel family protein
MCLGVDRSATPEQIRQAYRGSARRFHPDTNHDPQAIEEFKLVGRAYEVLNDASQRADYDLRTKGQRPFFRSRMALSRAKLLRLPEPQIVYALVDIAARPDAKPVEPALNLCLVIDQSTSMQGQRLDQVKSAARQIVETLNERDVFSIVAFSDRAEVVLPAQPTQQKSMLLSKISTIQARGGTEILHGLLSGLLELQRHLSSGMLNHLILLTDGRTYGDEDDCLLLAKLAELDGITITGLGIGDEWNDAFIDQLASTTGGHSEYVATPSIVTKLLTQQVRSLGDTFGRVMLQVICDPGVHLKSVFRVAPETQPIATTTLPASIGKLMANSAISLLFEFTVSTNTDAERALARLRFFGDILTPDSSGQQHTLDIRIGQSDTPDTAQPPLHLVAALDKLTLYRLQEKAWADAEEGNIVKATERLQTLASRLLASGENELASIAVSEANRLEKTHQISAENRKKIKYGTRALIPPNS